MFPRSYKVIPQTPTLPIDMTLYPSSVESCQKSGGCHQLLGGGMNISSKMIANR